MTDGEFNNLTVNNELLLPCDDMPKLSNQAIIDAIYRWVDGDWDPLGFTIGSSYIRFKGEYTENGTPKSQYLNLFLILSTENAMAPLLVTDQGFIVKKDIAAGGFFSSQQGVVMLGHGLNSATDPPKIYLTHSGSGYDTLYLKKANGTTPANMNLDTLNCQKLIFSGGGYWPVDFGNYRGFFLNESYSIDIATTNSSLNGALTRMRIKGGAAAYNAGITVWESIDPSDANQAHLGTNTKYWSAVYANYLFYHTSHGSFDVLDDLTLVKNYKTKMESRVINGEEVQVEVIDDESLTFLQNEHGFYDASTSVGFLLGCIKKLVMRLEKLEQTRSTD